jgi:hypothetical protein
VTLPPPLTLSAVETELLRDIRSRLSRKAVSEAAQLALGAAFVQACERVDMAPSDPLPVENLSAPAFVKAAQGADLKTLCRLVATLRDYRVKHPKHWPALVAGGVPQAVLSRRLALAGREQPVKAQ